MSAYRSRNSGSTATSAPRSQTASMAGPPPDANLTASSRNDMLPCAPTLASSSSTDAGLLPAYGPEADADFFSPSDPTVPPPNQPLFSSSGRGSGFGRIENRSPSTIATFPLVCTLRTPALHVSVTPPGARSAVVEVRGKPLSSKNCFAATPLRSTPYTLCPHAASHSMSTALPHSGTNTRLESSGGDVTPSPRSEFLCFMRSRWVRGRWKPMRPSCQRSCQSLTAAACVSASTEPKGAGSRGRTAVSVDGIAALDDPRALAAGPTDEPDRDAKTCVNPRISSPPCPWVVNEMPAATLAAAPTATEAMTAVLGHRLVAPRGISLEGLLVLLAAAFVDRLRRVTPAPPLGRQNGELPPPPSAIHGMPPTHDRRL